MPPIARIITLAGLMAAALPAAGAEGPPKVFDIAAIDAYVAAQVRDRGYPGLSLTIVTGGEVVLSKGYGLRDLAKGLPVEPDTAFSIGSVTKQFTCAGVLLLAEDGKLSVDDPVAKYFPGLTRAADITLYDLMTHASGYPDYYPLDFVVTRMRGPIAHDDLLKQYAGGKLDFEPGTRWSYSNTGYVLLGRVIEKVSGEPFGAFLARRILKPLGMDRSAFAPAERLADKATGYTTIALGPPQAVRPEGPGWLYAAGDLWASAPDLARWDLALMGGKVLRPEAYRLMTAPRMIAGERVRDYGCGIGSARRGGEVVLSHSGGVSGFQSYNAMIPRTKSAVILLANSEYLDPGSLHGTILDLVIRGGRLPDEAPAVPAVAGPPPKEAALAFFREMQAGRVDRAKLSDEFSAYLPDEVVAGAGERFGPLGKPEKVEASPSSERGGFEVTTITLTFKGGAVLKGTLYRSPDGKIQQLLFIKG
ncbi:serine hydrolase domain-containing protein [Tundrisphaera sp. TA3]|uniref:serine hydrolase domain-containing protein n=1 Tax=Tundrisphaera sp. TA3 TaxID=3435775 RepID=UPI003EB8AFE9